MIKIEELTSDSAKIIFKFWNANMGSQYQVTEKMIWQKIINDQDRWAPGSFLLKDDSKLIGLIVTKVNNSGLPECENFAWISTLIVDKEYRNQGFGKLLYSKTEEKLKEKGIQKLILGGERDNFFSGIPNPTVESMEFFKKRGFVLNIDQHYDLMADVSKHDFAGLGASLNCEDDFVTAVMTITDREKLAAFFDQSFPGRWKFEIMEYVDSGYDLQNVVLLWQKTTCDIVGFCKVFKSDNQSDLDEIYGSFWGSLGPIGISEVIRGKGLGKKILLDSLIHLQRRGARNIIIDWTVLKDFYGQFGFKPCKTYRGAYKYL
jgi:GNAT superfamily N-acetyltransferase